MVALLLSELTGGGSTKSPLGMGTLTNTVYFGWDMSMMSPSKPLSGEDGEMGMGNGQSSDGIADGSQCWGLSIRPDDNIRKWQALACVVDL